MPVQVEAVTDEELRIAEDLDWEKDFRQLIVQMRPKFLYLQQKGIIDGSTFFKLQRLQGIYVLFPDVMWHCNSKKKFLPLVH